MLCISLAIAAFSARSVIPLDIALATLKRSGALFPQDIIVRPIKLAEIFNLPVKFSNISNSISDTFQIGIMV